MTTSLSNDTEVTLLYGGEVRLEFSPKAHRYSVSDGGDPFHCPSVTTILNVLNKPALVEWGVRCACDFMAEHIGDLLEREDFSIEQVMSLIEKARQIHNKVKREAANIGTEAHKWLAQYWKAKLDLSPPPGPAGEGPVNNCILASLDWIKRHEVKPLFIEQPRYSRQFKIVGTPDFIGFVDGVMSVIDYKSTKNIYPEVALQMAPYAGMFEEEFSTTITNRWALRMDKVTGEFDDRKYTRNGWTEDMDTFICAYKLYDRLKVLRRKPQKEWLDELYVE
jgi:hypothetical protein